MARQRLEKVLEPGYIGKLKLKNRFVRMGSQSNIPMDDKGDLPVSPRWLDYYSRLAQGGFALIAPGGGMVKFNSDGTEGWSSILEIWNPKGLEQLAEVIHEGGAVASWQMILASITAQTREPGALSLGSSNLSQKDLDKLIPLWNPVTEMSKKQIEIATDLFAESAKRLQDCGFDCIELNAGHNHGLNSFLSPAWNKRTDEYGGDAAGRARIMVEIAQKIKDKCGNDFPVIANYNGCEFNLENGITVSDAIDLAKAMEEGGFDCIHSRYSFYHDALPEFGLVFTNHECPDIDLYPSYMGKDLSRYGIDNSFGKGIAGWAGAAAAIKANVGIPVSNTGRLDAFSGERLLQEGKIDFVNICRRAIADYDYCQKMIDGEYEEVRPCVGCFTCYETSEHGKKSWCMVNAPLLESPEYNDIKEADEKKRVLVVGSGAAGLESARVAALRGHEVILCEKESAIGGSLPLAGMIKDFQEDFLGFSLWQQRQVRKLGVDIRTKTLVNRDFVEKLKPDAVIVAVGGSENVPDIPGIDNKIVMTSEKLHNALKLAMRFFDVKKLGKLSKLYLPLGKKVAIMGGNIQALQTAHFLITRGREVIILEESNEFGTGMLDCGPKPNMLHWLVENNIEMHRNVIYKRIVDEGIVVANGDGEEMLCKVDNIVVTLPMLDNLDLYNEIKDAVPEIYAVGDCNPYIEKEPYPQLKLEPVESEPIWPRFTATAVREAYRVAHDL